MIQKLAIMPPSQIGKGAVPLSSEMPMVGSIFDYFCVILQFSTGI